MMPKMVCRIVIYLGLLCLFEVPALAQSYFLDHDGRQRSYFVHLPTAYTGNEDLPLILALHGGFGSAQNLQEQSQLNVKADKEHFIVVYPEGVQGPLNIRTWNAGWCCGFAMNANIDDVGFIDVLLDTLMHNYAVDSQRIYVTGISNGGMMAYRLACELSHKIAAIAPVAATMVMNDCMPKRPVSVIHFQSYLDTNVPYEGGVGSGVSKHFNPAQDSVVHTWAQINNCQILDDTLTSNEEYTLRVWLNGTCATAIHHYTTNDGGHSWPGGRSTVFGDPVSEYLNANDLMWEFFQDHSLVCKVISKAQVPSPPNFGTISIPNPNTGFFQVDLREQISGLQIFVYNRFGLLVFKTTEPRINIQNVPTGYYHLLFRSHQFSFSTTFLKI